MKVILRNFFSRLRYSMFPTKHDKVVKKWWLDGGDEKLRYEYDLNSDSLVVDLGGYKGQWTSDIYARYNCHILVFEPVRSFAAKIEERFKYNPKVEVFCLALGKNRRQEIIALGEDGSSLYRNAQEREKIECEDVAEFFAEHNIQSIDLMKVNIEGGEYELMSRLFDAGLINRIKYIQIQFHDVGPDSEMQMEELLKELAKTHRPTYQYKFVWENWVRRND